MKLVFIPRQTFPA